MTMACGVLICALFLSSSASAAEMTHDQHAGMAHGESTETTQAKPSEMEHDQHAEMNHDKPDEMGQEKSAKKAPTKPSEMNHDQHAGVKNEGHDATAGEPAVHVHPVETEADESKVGLDEKLGAILPLDLVFTD